MRTTERATWTGLVLPAPAVRRDDRPGADHGTSVNDAVTADDLRAATAVPSDAPDETLVAAAVAGDRDAFGRLVERHQRRVYMVCRRFTGSHEDAADLAQDVFVRAYRSLARFRGDAAFGTWLYRIAMNAALDRASAARRAGEPLDDAVAARLPEPGEGADERLEREERARRVRRAVAELPPRQRATLILRVYEELSLEETARVLGRSVGTVKATLFSAVRNLRARLARDERHE